MRQAIHILRKDVRYLWLDICFFSTLAWLWSWREYTWAEVLLPVTAAFFIARLIHAEPMPGDTQFWITRPYEWKSLLAAKTLFILVFLNLPVFIARVIIFYRSGFPIFSEMVPLLWSQFLIFVGFSLPVAALAAVTADMVTFIFSTLVLLVIASVIRSGTIPSIGLFHWASETAAWPEGIEWIRLATGPDENRPPFHLASYSRGQGVFRCFTHAAICTCNRGHHSFRSTWYSVQKTRNYA
jgi:hypothetical protein